MVLIGVPSGILDCGEDGWGRDAQATRGSPRRTGPAILQKIRIDDLKTNNLRRRTLHTHRTPRSC